MFSAANCHVRVTYGLLQGTCKKLEGKNEMGGGLERKKVKTKFEQEIEVGRLSSSRSGDGKWMGRL